MYLFLLRLVSTNNEVQRSRGATTLRAGPHSRICYPLFPSLLSKSYGRSPCTWTQVYLQRSAPIQLKTSKILPKCCQKLATTLAGCWLDGLFGWLACLLAERLSWLDCLWCWTGLARIFVFHFSFSFRFRFVFVSFHLNKIHLHQAVIFVSFRISI